MSKKKLLTVIIESHEEWHQKFKNHLTQQKHLQVESCYNASEFLYLLPSEPDIVVMDCEYMEMHPLILMNAIKEFNHETLLIMISAKENIELVKEHAQNIHIEYISKCSDIFNQLDLLVNGFINEKFHLYLKMDEAIDQRKALLERFQNSLNEFIENRTASDILAEFYNSRHSAQ